MANFTFSRDLLGTRLLSSNVFNDIDRMAVDVRTSSQLALSEQALKVNFFGSGVSYQMSAGQIAAITGGTITQITIVFQKQTVMTWSGLDFSASSMFTNLVSDDWDALNALLFSTGDTYNLTDGNDKARGFGGNDVMRGFDGNDGLIGDQGNDLLEGGLGRDKLTGGLGVDTISGGAGADSFVFTQSGVQNREVLTDFDASEDQMVFNPAAFAALGATSGPLAASRFVAGTAAADSADRLIYQKSTGTLWYDRDGSGDAAKVLVAELADGTTLTAADIFIL